MSFQAFKKLVEDQFNTMQTQQMLFETDFDVWGVYLDSFPPGTNEIFKVRREHDCGCCRNFVKNVGHLVTLDGKTVWDTAAVSAPWPFNEVAQRLQQRVKQLPRSHLYGASPVHFTFGSKPNYDPKNDLTWDHFYGQAAPAHRRTPEQIGALNTSYEVFKRGLEETNVGENLRQVIDLIKDNNLYRGQEHLKALEGFETLVQMYQEANDKERFIWANVKSPFARFRNTVIGTLIVDLCAGVDLEMAVRSFEAKVAPQNYKRPKSLITQKQIDDAFNTIEYLGLRDDLDRRMARFSDVSVEDVLFVDNEVSLKDRLKESLKSQIKTSEPDTKNAPSITIDELLAMRPEKMAILVENKHQGNFMTVTAPVHEGSGKLFKWPNNFAWAYDGDVADSIKERVKKAGGNVSAPFRVSLSWFNYDDLDIHVRDPYGCHIYFGNKMGKLDVDMNAGSGKTREAVENVSWHYPDDGLYEIRVDNFYKRESIDVGCDLEVEFRGRIFNFHYPKVLGSDVLMMSIKIAGDKITITPALGVESTIRSVEKWGVKTQVWTPVQTLILSPNFWRGSEVGNKHWFFILKDCINPGPVRGIFNEYLNPALEPHRKVFEILGAKTMAPPSPDQISGVGFSSTLGEEVFVQINGNRTFKVKLQ